MADANHYSNMLIGNRAADMDGAVCTLFLAILLLAPIKCLAASSNSAVLKAELGVAAMQFKYEEFTDTGGILDKEQGSIPGLTIKLGQRLTDWEWEGAGSYYNGRVPYAGQTNFGVLYNTRTDEAIGDVSARFGHWFGARLPVMPFAGIGYRRWDRNILPGGVGGLFESYRWEYLWVGSKFLTYQDRSSNFLLDVGLLKPLRPEMRIDFKGTYNVEPVVHPEGKIGLRVLLTSNLALTKRTGLTVEPYYEYWDMGRSPIVTAGPLTLYEPASKTHNIGLNLRLGWTM